MKRKRANFEWNGAEGINCRRTLTVRVWGRRKIGFDWRTGVVFDIFFLSVGPIWTAWGNEFNFKTHCERRVTGT